MFISFIYIADLRKKSIEEECKISHLDRRGLTLGLLPKFFYKLIFYYMVRAILLLHQKHSSVYQFFSFAVTLMD